MASRPRPRTVVIADQSVIVRGLFARWLGESGKFHVVAVAGDAETAVDQAGRLQPDVLVMDLEMAGARPPGALSDILRMSPKTAVLLSATLTERNARTALEWMTKGAMDVVSKPDSRSGVPLSLEIRDEFLDKLASIAQSQSGMGALPPDQTPEAASHAPINLRPLVTMVPRYLAIGASTGGPRAVARVLTDIGQGLNDLTTLIVQHMPPLFTASFAEQISGQIGVPAREPYDGERLSRGTIYIAPGGRHLGIDRRLGHLVATITDDPPVRFCRPAVDVLFTQAARHIGPAALGLVLTGMGSDGTDGASALRRSGAAVIAQDEFSSTIWGMPGSVVRARQASAVIPLDSIGEAIRNLVHGSAAA